MSITQHAAVTAVASLCVAGLLGLSSPGLASEMAEPAISTPSVTAFTGINGETTIKFPTKATPEIPGVTVQRLPGDEADAADADDDAPDYASLKAAVEAQDMPESVDPELACLAGAIYFESKGEPLSGQLAVADVILNRTKSDDFPSTICGVVTQPGQFSFVRNGRIPHINTKRRSYRTAMAVAQVAMDDHWKSPVPAALYFHAKRVRPGWGFTQVASIGHHIFYR